MFDTHAISQLCVQNIKEHVVLQYANQSLYVPLQPDKDLNVSEFESSIKQHFRIPPDARVIYTVDGCRILASAIPALVSEAIVTLSVGSKLIVLTLHFTSTLGADFIRIEIEDYYHCVTPTFLALFEENGLRKPKRNSTEVVDDEFVAVKASVQVPFTVSMKSLPNSTGVVLEFHMTARFGMWKSTTDNDGHGDHWYYHSFSLTHLLLDAPKGGDVVVVVGESRPIDEEQSIMKSRTSGTSMEFSPSVSGDVLGNASLSLGSIGRHEDETLQFAVPQKFFSTKLFLGCEKKGWKLPKHPPVNHKAAVWWVVELERFASSKDNDKPSKSLRFVSGKNDVVPWSKVPRDALSSRVCYCA